MSQHHRHPESIVVGIVVASDRCAAGVAVDRSGARLAELARAAGYQPLPVLVVPDGASEVQSALMEMLDAGARAVLTSGGTGIGPRDRTPEGTRPLIERELPGVMESLRRVSEVSTPTAVLSRGVAGVTADGVLLVNLPGSPAGVEAGWRVLEDLLPHVLDQADGGDHA